jgi:sulfate permease, SulP family
MQYIDQSGLYAMEDVLVDLASRGISVLLVNVLEQPRYMLERIDIIPDLVPEEQIFKSFKDCLNWINVHIKNK